MSTPLVKFFQRPPADRVLLLHAACLHAVVAGLIRCDSSMRSIAWLRACYRPRRNAAPRNDEGRVCWAVRAAVRVLPAGKTCLSEALTAQLLLRRCGCEAVLRVGVAPLRGGRIPFAAHAWLERSGRTIVGGDVSAYRPLRQAHGHR